MAIDLTQIQKTLKEIAEKTTQVSETAAAIPEPKPIFDVDTPTGEVDISQLDSLPDLRNQVRGLETRLTSEQEAQQELISALEPTPRALELQQQLLAERQAGRVGEEEVRRQPIPQPLIGRQAELLREQIALKELPLIEELKLEAQRQQTVFEKAKARLGFETAGIERVLDLEKEFRQMDRTQREDARGLLEGIIGSLEGMAFEDLSPEQQTMLEGVIADTGISSSIIKAGMENAKRLAEEKLGKVTSTFRDIAGQVTQIITDEAGNIIRQTPIGMSGIEARRIKESIASFNSADSMLSTIEDLATNVITAEKPEDIPEQYVSGNIGAITRFNPDARVFLDTKDAFSSMLTRAAGEKGVLTTQDVQRIIQALPTLVDTKQIAQMKFKTLRSLYESIKIGAIKAYTTPIEEIIGGEVVEPTKIDISDLNFQF